MSQGVSSVQVVTSRLANLLLCYILKSDFEILWSVSCAEAQRGMVKGGGGGGLWSKCKIWSVIGKKFCACTHFVQKREICGDYV